MLERAQLAVAIAAANTTEALELAAESAAGGATLVEFRLDLMGDFDLPLLVASSPLPAIVTCRPSHQGGRFSGSEGERLSILRRAAGLGAAFVDAEIEVLPHLAGYPHPRTRLIGSHHEFGSMICEWDSLTLQLAAAGADVIKLVGMATHSDEALPPLAWLAGLGQPGIAIAMGSCGLATRLLAPRFDACLLSFAAIGGGTAPGQIDLGEMVGAFGFHHLTGADPLLVLFTPPTVPWDMVQECRQALDADASLGPAAWLLPIPTPMLGSGLIAACQLARSDGVLCLPTVERDPRLNQSGIRPDQFHWGRMPDALVSLVAA